VNDGVQTRSDRQKLISRTYRETAVAACDHKTRGKMTNLVYAVRVFPNDKVLVKNPNLNKVPKPSKKAVDPAKPSNEVAKEIDLVRPE